MKKYSIAIPLFAMLLTACDPTIAEEGSIAASITETDLQARCRAYAKRRSDKTSSPFSTNHADRTGIGSRRGHPSYGTEGSHHRHSPL